MRRSVFILLQFIPLLIFAQGQNNNWYFGLNAGITFNTNPPSALTNGQLNTFEGCAAISDNAGNLLFYTDGTTVYNKLHAIMTNGSALFGQLSSTQSAIIVPLPGSNTIYYIFTLDAFAGTHGVCYSIVDMTLSGGLGSVTIKNQLILTPASEKITVIKNSNNHDFWVLIHGWNNNNFYAYQLTSAGFNSTPVITSIGSSQTGGGGPNNANNAIGYLKVNSAGNVIALAISMSYFYETYQFNNSTGVLSNFISIPNPDNTNVMYPYGLEFSPDSHYLYLKDFYSQNIYQYDMSVYNATSIINSKTLVGTISGTPIYYNGAMQLGPDNKIYLVEYGLANLAVINNPNNPAATCGLVDNAISLNGRIGQLGLPCLVNQIFYNNPIVISAHGCYNQMFHFYLSDSTSISGVNWNFGDPASGAGNTSTLFSPTHLFSNTGNYIVTAIVSYSSGMHDTSTYNVTISAPPNLFSVDSVFQCNGSAYTAQVSGSWSSYLWSTIATTSSIPITQTGIYNVTVTDTSGCKVSDTLKAVIGNSVQTHIDTTFCAGLSVIIDGHNITSSGTYTNNYLTSQGCDSVVMVQAIVNIGPSINLPHDTTLCLGESMTISPAIIGSYNSMVWGDGYSGTSRLISDAGVYSVKIEGDCGIAQDQMTVSYENCQSEIWFPNTFTPNGDMINPVFKAEGINILEFHLLIYNRWGQLIYEGSSIDQGWDGTFNGKECMEGIYAWIANYRLYRNSNKVEEKAKGSVLLIR